MITCDAALPGRSAAGWLSRSPAGWLPICAAPATALHRYACIHEHVSERATCDDHAPQPGAVGCRRCWDAGHECPLTAQLVAVLP